MPGLTPAGLYDELEYAIARATTARVRRRQPVVWFNAPTVTVNGRQWKAPRRNGDRYGYTLAQARQMQEALLPVLAEHATQLRNLLAGAQHQPRPAPHRHP